jgi:argininosuccinate synthase
MQLKDLQGKTIAFAASGGLDSCTVTRWLSDHDVKVVAMTAHLGQPDEPDIGAIEKRMRACGAADFALLDARDALVEAGLGLVQAQACYEGKYWNTTGIARHVTTRALLGEMKRRKIGVLSHGATGRGNDQVRFQLCANMLAPEVQVYAPWRDSAFLERFGGRQQMIDFCNERGLPITATKKAPYSTDANILGLTHEAGVLESLETGPGVITPGMGVHAKDAPASAEEVEIRFEQGRPVAIQGQRCASLLSAFEQANTIAGRHGVGIAFHLVENRFVGIKSRGVYESPGMELLGSAYALLLQLILDRRARNLFDELSRYLAQQVYQGYGFDLGSQMAYAALQPVSRLVTGTVRVALLKGSIHYVSAREVPHCLYQEDMASMEAIGSYDHGDSEGLLRVLGVSARALAAAGQIAERA